MEITNELFQQAQQWIREKTNVLCPMCGFDQTTIADRTVLLPGVNDLNTMDGHGIERMIVLCTHCGYLPCPFPGR